MTADRIERSRLAAPAQRDGLRLSSGSRLTLAALGVVYGDIGTSPLYAVRQSLIDRTPMGRLGTAEDIANGVLFLASDEASWVTGSELVIDGGMTSQ